MLDWEDAYDLELRQKETKEERRARRKKQLDGSINELQKLDIERKQLNRDINLKRQFENKLDIIVDLAKEIKTGNYSDSEIGRVFRELVNDTSYL